MGRSHSGALAVAIFCLSACAFGQSDFSTQYSTIGRVQISEPCSLVAKWLTQALSSGPHWQLLRYDPELGLLTFKIVDSGDLAKREVRQYIADAKAKNVHAEQLVITLRSLVGSILSFDNAQPVKADSCTLAAGFKFVGRNGNTFLSNGRMEAETLQRFKDRYVQHGLDY